MSLNVKANGKTYSLEESLQVTTKTLSNNPSMPPIQVIQYGKIVLVRCSAYPKAAMTKDTEYQTSLGTGEFAVSTDTRYFPLYGQDSGIWVSIAADGKLHITPKQNLSTKDGVNFSIANILK